MHCYPSHSLIAPISTIKPHLSVSRDSWISICENSLCVRDEASPLILDVGGFSTIFPQPFLITLSNFPISSVIFLNFSSYFCVISLTLTVPTVDLNSFSLKKCKFLMILSTALSKGFICFCYSSWQRAFISLRSSLRSCLNFFKASLIYSVTILQLCILRVFIYSNSDYNAKQGRANYDE